MIFWTWRNETNASGERRPEASVPMFIPTYGSLSGSAAIRRKPMTVLRFLKQVKSFSFSTSSNQEEVVTVILPSIRQIQ